MADARICSREAKKILKQQLFNIIKICFLFGRVRIPACPLFCNHTTLRLSSIISDTFKKTASKNATFFKNLQCLFLYNDHYFNS